jgi:putative endonuclease
MSEQSDLGKKGEELAAAHLRKNGYTILKQNYRFSSRAEVDIVACKDDHLIFVEVKTRVSAYLNDPALMVPMKKQRQIIKAATDFITRKQMNMPWRFDIISIVFNKEYTKLNHIEDAFYPVV